MSEEEESYDWSSMHRVLSLFRDLCFDENELRELVMRCPRLVFEDSRKWTLLLAGCQTKLGSSRTELWSFFYKFPEIKVKRCVLNIRHCFLFLNQIKMECDKISGKALSLDVIKVDIYNTRASVFKEAIVQATSLSD
ncbi:unnamed protein product [Arabis nemorensis]|uniref:Uncharacterized protein n=1 Tax=Arabis nemorensis TaxID=586526 RepID=A0A565C4A0_9BRAS|nr:unnamed protein product [Arabis nemorensis]